MTITYLGTGNFEAKTNNGLITLGEKFKIDDFSFDNSGEYEVKSIDVEILDKMAIFRTEGISLGYLAKRSEALNQKEKDFLSGVDILFIPVGAPDTLKTKDALNIIAEIDPKMVIPSCYENLDEFCKEGECGEPLDNIKISKDRLPSEERETVILKAAK